MRRLFEKQRQIAEFLRSSPYTSLGAGMVALGQVLSLLTNLDQRLIDALTVLGVCIIGFFARDEKRKGE